MKAVAKTVLMVLAGVVVITLVVGTISPVIRWFFSSGGVSVEQARTIDSLRVVNSILDSNLTISVARQDTLRKQLRRQQKADSLATKRSVDSLKALIPDTATVVPRPIHEAIVTRLENRVLTLERAVFVSDSLLDERTNDLSVFRVQNAALLAQVNSLEKKANPNLLRRAKIAAPFVGVVYGSCKLGLIKCD